MLGKLHEQILLAEVVDANQNFVCLAVPLRYLQNLLYRLVLQQQEQSEGRLTVELLMLGCPSLSVSRFLSVCR